MVIRELLIKLGLTGGEQAGRELDRVDGKVRSTISAFQALGGALAALGAVTMLKNIAHAGDEMQALEFRLGQMVTSANGGAEAMDNLTQHAQSARVSIESYAEAYTGIGAATHELIHTQEDLLTVTDSVAMGLQLAGANAQQTTSVMQQLTQAIAVGKLQWEDMRVIMQNSDAFALRLAKSMGMTLNEMVKATQGKGGGIGADKIVNALRDMSGEVRKQFLLMPLTIGQATTIMGIRWDAFINKLNRSTHFISRIADAFIYLMDKVERSITSVSDAVGGLGNVAKITGIVLAAAFAPGIIFKFGEALKWLMLTPGGRLLWLLAGVGLVAEDLFGWVIGGNSAIGLLLGDFKDLGKNWDKTISQMKKEFWGLFGTDSFEGLLKRFDDLLNSLGERMENWAKGIWAHIFNNLPTGFQTFLSKVGLAPTSVVKSSASGTSSMPMVKQTSFSDAARAMANVPAPVVTGGLFTPHGVSYGQRPTVHTEYKPNVQLHFHNNTDNPKEIENIVNRALGDLYYKFQERQSNDLLFSGIVR